MAELKSHLVLVDEEGEYVDDTGGVHPLDPESAREQSRVLLGEIAQTLGTYKKTSQGVKKEKSHSFGGHDLIKHIYDLAFVIPASGLTIEIFKLVRKWMDVLKTRAHRRI